MSKLMAQDIKDLRERLLAIEHVVQQLEYFLETKKPSLALDPNSPVFDDLVTKEEIRRWCDQLHRELDK